MKALTLVIMLGVTADAAPACKPTGAVIFEIDHDVMSDKPSHEPTSTTKLSGNGAWVTQVTTWDGKPAPTAGCVEPAAFAKLRADLEAAPWKTTYRDVDCKTSSVKFTEYRWRGKLVFTAKECNGVTLDDKSQRALAEAEQLLR